MNLSGPPPDSIGPPISYSIRRVEFAVSQAADIMYNTALFLVFETCLLLESAASAKRIYCIVAPLIHKSVKISRKATHFRTRTSGVAISIPILGDQYTGPSAASGGS